MSEKWSGLTLDSEKTAARKMRVVWVSFKSVQIFKWFGEAVKSLNACVECTKTRNVVWSTWKACRICLLTCQSYCFTFLSFPVSHSKGLQQNPPFHLSVQEADSEADVVPTNEIFLRHTKNTFDLSSLPCHVNLLLIGNDDAAELNPLLVVVDGELAHLVKKRQKLDTNN